jgi:hypothetical protein
MAGRLLHLAGTDTRRPYELRQPSRNEPSGAHEPSPPAASALHEEARHIHRALFGADAPDELQRQYASVLRAASPAPWPGLDMNRLLATGADLEALELALRRRQMRNALTQRFQVVCYLAEARPENYERFVTEPRRALAGWLSLAFHGIRSLYKLAKGRRLMQIHGLR